MYCRHAASELRLAFWQRGIGWDPASRLLDIEDSSYVLSPSVPTDRHCNSLLASPPRTTNPELDGEFPAAQLDAKVPDSVRRLVERFEGERKECLVILFFDQFGIYLDEARLSCGLISQIAGRFRPIVSLALALGARKLLLAHNHLSGSTSPSENDVRFTLNLMKICKPLEIAIVDHVIIAGASAASMRGANLL